MVLTGQQLISLGIVRGSEEVKIDNLVLPSYGPDGCGVTLRGAWLSNDKLISIEPLKSISTKSKETIYIPKHMVGLLKIKSTYSRQGIMLVTDSPVDPGYCGTVTLRLFNSSDESVNIYVDGGIAMLLVHHLTAPVSSYNGRHANNF